MAKRLAIERNIASRLLAQIIIKRNQMAQSIKKDEVYKKGKAIVLGIVNFTVCFFLLREYKVDIKLIRRNEGK